MSFEDIRGGRGRSTDPEPGPSMDSFKRVVSIFLAKEEAADARAVGEGVRLPMPSFSAVAWLVAVLVTCAYIFFELRWNATLVAGVFGGKLTEVEMRSLVDQGRWLAAFGLGWALCKSLISGSSSVGRLVFGACLLSLLTVTSYRVIDRAYEAAVDAIPDQVGNMLYKTAVYRSSALATGGSEMLQDPISSVLTPIALLEEKSVQAIEGGLQKKVEDAAQTAGDRAEALWAQYQDRVRFINNQEAYLAQFDRAYDKFSRETKNIRSWFGGLESSRKEDFKRLYGFEFNPSYTKLEFAQAMKASHIKSARDMGAAYVAVQEMKSGGKGSEFEISGIKFRATDFEGVKTKEEFVAKVELLAADQIKTVIQTSNASTGTSSREAVAAAILPPIAVALSALVIALNTASLVGLLASKTPGVSSIPSVIWPLSAALVVLALPKHELPGLSGGLAVLNSQVPYAADVVQRLANLESMLLKAAVILF